jgi:hypothetical protein
MGKRQNQSAGIVAVDVNFHYIIILSDANVAMLSIMLQGSHSILGV